MNNTINKLIAGETIKECALVANSQVSDNGNSGYVSKALNEYVQSGIDVVKNNDVVKIIAAAMQMTNETNVSDVQYSSPLNTAITAVNFAKSLNLSYLAETGRIKAHQIADSFIDQATANASVVAKVLLQSEVIEMGLNRALDYVGCLHTSLIPIANVAKRYTPVVASFLSKNCAPAVEKGINMVSDCAKQVVHKTIDTTVDAIKSAGKKIGEFVKSIFAMA